MKPGRREVGLMGTVCLAGCLLAVLGIALRGSTSPPSSAGVEPRVFRATAEPPARRDADEPALTERRAPEPARLRFEAHLLAAAADALAAADDDADDAQLLAERAARGAPETEAEYFDELVDFGREHGVAALEAESLAVLDGPGPTAEKVAALRALRAVGAPGEERLWLHALAELAPEDGRASVSVPAYVMGEFTRRSVTDGSAREILHGVIEGAHAVPDARLVREAATFVARFGTPEDLQRLARALTPYDADLFPSVAAAMSVNEHGPEAVSAFAHLFAGSEPRLVRRR